MSYAATTALTFASRIAALLLSTLTAIVLARSLGPAARGDYALVTVVAQWVLAFANLGHGQAQVHFVGRDRTLFPRAASNVAVFTLGATAAVAVVLWIGAAPLRAAFPVLGGVYLLAVVASVAPLLLYTLLYELLRGRRAFALTAGITLFAYTAQLAVLGLFVGPLALGLAGAVGAWLVAHTLLAIVTVGAAWREGGFARPDVALLRGSLGLGVVSYATSLFIVATTRAGILLAALFLTSADVGVLVVAITLAELLWYLADPAAFVLAPVVAGDAAAAQRLTPLVTRLVGATAAALALLGGVLAQPLVVWLFGREYEASAAVFRWLLPGVVIYSVARILVSDLLGRGRPGLGIAGIGAGAAVSILAGVLLIPSAGVTGAAVAATLAYVTATAVVVAGYVRLTGLSWPALLIVRASDLQRVGSLARRFLWYRPAP